MGGQPIRPNAPRPTTNTPNKPTRPTTPLRPRAVPGGAIGGGGQNVYKPFENDKLDWLLPTSETAAPAVSRQGGSKPSILLFIGRKDAESCCARTFERVVFRDQAVVEYAKEKFLAVRIERESAPAKAFDVKGPELVIQDAEGAEVARFIECCEPSLVLEILRECDKRAKEVAARTAEWTPKLVRADTLIDQGQTREPAEIVAKALREKSLSRITKEKVERLAKALDERAQARLDEAKAKDDPIESWRLYRQVRDDFWGLPASARAKAAITAIEKDPANKEALKAAREAEAKGKPAPKAAPPAAKPGAEDYDPHDDE